MTNDTKTQKLHKNIKTSALDFADAVLDLACHHAEDAPEDQERINVARVYMHEVAGGDNPVTTPQGDILFTVGALLSALPDDQSGVKELRVALMPALGSLLDPAKSMPPAAKTAPTPCPSSRPPGVPNSHAKRGFDGKFYLKHRRRNPYR